MKPSSQYKFYCTSGNLQLLNLAKKIDLLVRLDTQYTFFIDENAHLVTVILCQSQVICFGLGQQSVLREPVVCGKIKAHTNATEKYTTLRTA